jgi:hypothetical protein
MMRPLPKTRSKRAIGSLSDNDEISTHELQRILLVDSNSLRKRGVKPLRVEQYGDIRLAWWRLGDARSYKRDSARKGVRLSYVLARKRALQQAIKSSQILKEAPPVRSAVDLEKLSDDVDVTTPEVTKSLRAAPQTLWAYTWKKQHPALKRKFKPTGWIFWKEGRGYGWVATWNLGEIKEHLNFLLNGNVPPGLTHIEVAAEFTDISTTSITNLIRKKKIVGGQYYAPQRGYQKARRARSAARRARSGSARRARSGSDKTRHRANRPRPAKQRPVRLQWFVNLDQLDRRRSYRRKGRVNYDRVFLHPETGKPGYALTEAREITGWFGNQFKRHRSTETGGLGKPCKELDGGLLHPWTKESSTYIGETNDSLVYPADSVLKIEAKVKGFPKPRHVPTPPDGDSNDIVLTEIKKVHSAVDLGTNHLNHLKTKLGTAIRIVERIDCIVDDGNEMHAETRALVERIDGKLDERFAPPLIDVTRDSVEGRVVRYGNGRCDRLSLTESKICKMLVGRDAVPVEQAVDRNSPDAPWQEIYTGSRQQRIKITTCLNKLKEKLRSDGVKLEFALKGDQIVRSPWGTAPSVHTD